MSEPAGVYDAWQLAEAVARGPFAAENSELRALLREAADLLEAAAVDFERLATSETMTAPFALDRLNAGHNELRARMRYAQNCAPTVRALLPRLRAVLPQDEPTP